MLRGEGLDRTIEWLAHRIGEAYHMAVTVENEEHIEVASTVQVLLFQTVRELLFNVVKHAGTSEARVTLGLDDDQVLLVIEDEGVGFDPAEVEGSAEQLPPQRPRADPTRGGDVEVEAAPGEGTRVTVRCPAGL